MRMNRSYATTEMVAEASFVIQDLYGVLSCTDQGAITVALEY